MTTKTTYKVGDKVRILDANAIMACEAKDGDILEVIDVEASVLPTLRDVDGEGLCILGSELKYIEKVAEQVAKFKVGDKVRIIGVGAAGLPIGTEAKVTQVDWDGDVYLDIKNVHGNKAFYLACNIELVSPKPTKKQRLTSAEQAISSLEQKVEAMQAEIDALKAAQKPKSILSGEGTLIFDGKPIAKVSGISYKTMTTNEQRKAIINEAKAFVEELSDIIRGAHKQETKFGRLNDVGYTYVLKPEFHINSKKRVVTVLMKGGNRDSGKVYAKGIAKCNPSDVFNADIGKAIALGRALGLDVSKFEKAVQPTELVVGHIVTKVNGPCGLGRIGSVEDGKARIEDQFGFWETTIANSSTLLELDDTEAQY